MERTSEFAGNSTANIKLSKRPLDSEQLFTKSKNVATKILCNGVVALTIPRKLTCDSFLLAMWWVVRHKFQRNWATLGRFT